MVIFSLKTTIILGKLQNYIFNIKCINFKINLLFLTSYAMQIYRW